MLCDRVYRSYVAKTVLSFRRPTVSWRYAYTCIFVFMATDSGDDLCHEQANVYNCQALDLSNVMQKPKPHSVNPQSA
jgi:hypothetical protein